MSDHLPPEKPFQRLSLGTDAQGRSWELEFATGNLTVVGGAQLVGDDNSTLIVGADLTHERLARLLVEGGWRAQRTPSDLVSLKTQIGEVYAFVVSNGSELNLIRPYQWEAPEDGWESAETQTATEESLCREAFMVRFVAQEDGSGLVAHYALPLAAGVTRAQVLEIVRRFVAETARAIEHASCEEVLK